MAPVAEIAGNPAEFPVLDRWNYLNHAGVSPLPRTVADAMRRFAESFSGEAYLGGFGFGEVEACRAALAKLMNAAPDTVALLKNTAEAISTVAFGLDWRPGDRIVLPAVEYPANIYPWMELRRRAGVELTFIPERRRADGSLAIDVTELLDAARHDRCRMVALSHVQYGSGQRLPLGQIGAWCRQHGRLLCVDAIQSLGALPVDVEAMRVDFLAAGSQKWLLGPMGAGVLFVRKELAGQVRPLAVGAYSVAKPEPYGEIDYTLAPDCRRHESGTPPLPSLAGLRAAVELLLGAGIDAVAGRIHDLTDRLVAALAGRGFRVASPRDAGQWSGIVSFLPPTDGIDLEALCRRLRKERRIEILVRENRLRASPHFYNTGQQIDALVTAVAERVTTNTGG